MEKLYRDTSSLYRLDQFGNRNGVRSAERKAMGELPRTAVALIASLFMTWILMILYVVFSALKKGKNR